MSLILDPATEQRLQQELAAGRYRDPSALIAHGLELVQADHANRGASPTHALVKRRA